MLTKTTYPKADEDYNSSRRKFLGKVGGVAAITALAAACQKDINAPASLSTGSSDDLSKGSFGTGDVAILNYAYLLEQLEAAFYIMVTGSFYSGATDWEQARLRQVRDHEIAHREFFKTALGKAAIPDIEFDFSSIDFKSRKSVLSASKTFEDTGVSAYNGVAYKIQDPDYLVAAGKIVSVEARHAAYIRELLQVNSFADSSVVDIAGLDVSNPPAVVIQAVKPFIKTTTMNFNTLPQ